MSFDVKRDCYRYNRCYFCIYGQMGCPILRNPNNVFKLNQIKEKKHCFCCDKKTKCHYVAEPCVGEIKNETDL